jgi:hypothetical protein
LMPNQEVCAANTVTRYLGNKACVSSCNFIPEVDAAMMICAIEDDVNLANVKLGASYINGDFGKLYTWFSVVHTSFVVLNACLCLSTFFLDRSYLTIQHRCDCSCDDLQPVERPRPIIMVRGLYEFIFGSVFSL